MDEKPKKRQQGEGSTSSQAPWKKSDLEEEKSAERADAQRQAAAASVSHGTTAQRVVECKVNLMSDLDILMMASTKGMRCNEISEVCRAWNKHSARPFKEMEHLGRPSAETPEECKAVVWQLLKEMQARNLTPGTAETIDGGDLMVCHFHTQDTRRATHWHGTPIANLPSILKTGMRAYADEGQPKLGAVVFCCPDKGYNTALNSYSPWTWVGGANTFFRAVLCLHCQEEVKSAGRGTKDAKQYCTRKAEVVGVDIEACTVEKMAAQSWFFTPPATTGPGRQRLSAVASGGMS